MLIQTDADPTTAGEITEEDKGVDLDRIMSGLHSWGKIQLSPFLGHVYPFKKFIQSGYSQLIGWNSLYTRKPFAWMRIHPWIRLPKLVLIHCQRSKLPAVLFLLLTHFQRYCYSY